MDSPVAADPSTVVDVEALERQTGGDVGLRREIVAMFLEDCPQRMEAMEAALAAGDTNALMASAHALKGSAAYLKAPAVRDGAAEIERLAREGRAADRAAAFEALRAAVAALLPELRKLTL